MRMARTCPRSWSGTGEPRHECARGHRGDRSGGRRHRTATRRRRQGVAGESRGHMPDGAHMRMNHRVHDKAHLPHRKVNDAPGEAGDTEVPTPTKGAQPAAADDLKSLPVAEVEKRLGSSPDGLSQAEAAKRLVQFGPNEIEE